MQKVVCDNCKREVHTNMYFYNERIIVNNNYAMEETEYYEAIVYGRAICPLCGMEIKKLFKKEIYKDDIIDLAGCRGE